MKRALPQTVAPSKLNLPTIMDRTLAQKHGAQYVHLVVFAIDIDRVYTETAPLTEDDLLDPTDPKAQAEQPFGVAACCRSDLIERSIAQLRNARTDFA